MVQQVFFFILTYLLGSINFAVLIFRVLGKEDPRGRFSGNAGTTNTYRQAGLFWAAVVLLLDTGRAVGIAFLAVKLLSPAAVPWACFFLVAGNRFPLFHGFRGGKGVAQYLGFTFFINPWAGIVSCIAWVITYGILRVPFIASFFMIAVLATGTIMHFFEFPASIAGAVATALFIFVNHARNIIDYSTKKKVDRE